MHAYVCIKIEQNKAQQIDKTEFLLRHIKENRFSEKFVTAMCRVLLNIVFHKIRLTNISLICGIKYKR